MAAAIPILVSFASAAGAVSAAGGVMAAMSTVTGFLSIAGAALTTVGAITKKQDLMKIGGFMQLGGAIGSAYNAYGAAARGAAGSAGSAAGSAGSAAADAALTAASPEASGMIANMATQEAAKGAFTPSIMQSLTSLNAPQTDYSLAGRASQSASGLPSPGSSIAGPQTATLAGGELAGTGIKLQNAGLVDPLTAGAGAMQPAEYQSFLSRAAQKTGSALRGVGKFVQDNKELVKMGGEALGSMYGPEAELMDFRKSIYNRRMANLNNPVRLGTTGGG